MKRLISAALAASILFLGGCNLPGEQGNNTEVNVHLDNAELTPWEGESGDFGGVLAHLLDDGVTNQVMSPLSAYIALAMAGEGADGETKAQFEKLLGISMDDVGEYLYNAIAGLNETAGSTAMSVAQSVWTDDDVVFSNDYLNRLGEMYSSEIYSGKLPTTAMRKSINTWANDKTNGLIKELLSENLDKDTVLVLINALYFKGLWQTEFNEYTAQKEFNNYDGTIGIAEYMFMIEKLRYFETDDAFGVVLPYDDGKTEFIAFLPKDETLLPSELMANLGADGIISAAKGGRDCMVDLAMPTFDVRCTYSLNSALRATGLNDAFEPMQANFTKMGESEEGSFISNVIQSVNITVDTKGTEAAAVSAVLSESGGVPPEYEIELSFDRPFGYMIVDKGTDIPLFVGSYNYAR